MTTTQYNAPLNLKSSFSSYYLIDKNTVKNTVSVNSNNNLELIQSEVLEDCGRWYICFIGTHYYFINKEKPNYYLSFQSDASSCIVTQSINNSGWVLNYFGVDTPCIKQNKNNYCGAASVLQAVYGCRGEPIICEDNELLSTQVSAVAGRLGITTDSTGASMEDMLNVINGTSLLNESAYSYAHITQQNDLISKITSSLANGFPVIVYVYGYKLEHYPDDTNYGGHYICVTGYDSITGNFLIADCMYVRGYFGLHIVTASNLFFALRTESHSDGSKYTILYHNG